MRLMITEIKSRLNGAASDSLILSFVRIVTVVFGLLSTKLLSSFFSLQEYGTYSQAMLICSTITSLSVLGLTDATNYFYNAADDEERIKRSIATIFGIQYIVGLTFGFLICLFQIPIVKYFNNEELKGILYIVAWMPILNNLIPMLQVLFISIGKAKMIAVRNFVVSASRLLFIAVSFCFTDNVKIVFILLLLLDIAQVAIFYYLFSKNRFRIRLSDFRKTLIMPVLRFSIPMAAYVFTSALARDIDKYVISFFSNTETLAIYTNAAKPLPFDLLSASFLTVLVPIVTRQVRNGSLAEAKTSLKAYLRVGYLTTWIFVAGAIVTAKEMIAFLYDEKYFPGLPVFIVYLLVDVFRFSNMTLILVASGKTRTLMKWSIISLLANAVLDVGAFSLIGILGPAIITLLITIALTIQFLRLSAKQLQTSFSSLFDWNEVVSVIVKLLIVGVPAFGIKRLLNTCVSSYVIVLLITYGFFVTGTFILNRKRLLNCFALINSIK